MVISLRIVKSSAPELLPLFRSDEQARLLVEVYLRSAEGSSLAALARATGISPGGVHKEIERLEKAGIVTSERVGRSRIVRPNSASPFHGDLRSLLMKAFGPARLLEDSLAGVGGVEEAFIYGSWARAAAGDLEGPPRDIDLMVIGEVDLDLLYDRLLTAEAELGRVVNVTVFTTQEWASDDSGFVRHVREQPVVRLIGSGDD